MYNDHLIFYRFLYLQKKILKGQYKCFLIPDIALYQGKFAGVSNMLRVEIGQCIKGLDQGGFSNLWMRQIRNFYNLKAIKWPSMKVASPYISTNTLASFSSTVGIILILLWTIFIAELLSYPEMRRTLWKRIKGYYIAVYRGFGELCKYLIVRNKVEGRQKYDKKGRSSHRKLTKVSHAKSLQIISPIHLDSIYVVGQEII